MSTISTLAQAGGVTSGTRQWAPTPVLYSNTIDFAAALAAKGSALAADDIIECIRFPAGVLILGAGIQTMTASDSTTLTLHLGITGGDIDGFVASYDNEAAAVGDYATSLFDTSEIHTIMTAADSIDMELATLTGTLTTGVVRVWALIVNLNGVVEPGLVQVGT